MDNIRKIDNLFFIGDENKPDAFLKVDINEEDKVLSIVSTMVDTRFRGQGIAGKLTKEVAEYAKAEGYKIEPVCSYAVDYFEKNDLYKDLIK